MHFEQHDEVMSCHALPQIDRCRRLLQGAETGLQPGENHTADRVQDIRNKLSVQRRIVEHLLEHMDEGRFDVATIQEIHMHLDDLDTHLSNFHTEVEKVSSRWRRVRWYPDAKQGETVPLGLLIPVCIDAFVDGFLIGIACGLSPKAGYILGVANCLEMGFLGLALTARVMKCTGSSLLMRYAAIVLPPLIMWLAAPLGGFIGAVTLAYPIVYVSFVSFGVLAILFLVCNELLIEAKEAQGEEERWWISAMVFMGIYIVLILNGIVPE